MYKCTGANVSCTQNIQKTQDNVKFFIIRMIGLQNNPRAHGGGGGTSLRAHRGKGGHTYAPSLPMDSGAVLQSYHSNDKTLHFLNV
jgi:hypothetical protein